MKEGEKQEKEGLMIGFISNGMVPTKWMMRINELGAGIPSGMFWKFCWYEGKDYKEKGGYAKARQKVVEQARNNNSKYLMFLDTDVFPPPDVITKLMSHNKPITCGIYYMKSSPAQPVIFKKMGSGPYWDFPVEELIEIDGSGLGCTLIDMDVFDKFEEKGLPFFDENWLHVKEDGSKVRVKVGEDHYFFIKAKELGYQTYCDTSILCDHLDTNTGVIFPGEEEVTKIRERVLKKKGQGQIIDKEKILFDLDPDKKTIVFYNATPSEFSGDELERRGVGGSEGDIINLAKIFAKQYNVIVFCNCPRQGIFDGVRYVHAENTEWMKKFKTDLFVASRNTHLLADVNFKEYFNVEKVCLWTHDLAESYVFDKLPKALPNIDRIFTLTKWHTDNIRARFRDITEDKWFNARNGVDVELYKDEVERNPFKLIYSSTPFRGLDVLLEVFPMIKSMVPQAELHIFSSMKVYGNHNMDEDKKFQELYEKAQKIEGITYHGTVTRRELAKHMKESAVLAYPNHYPETCCITAMEAVTAGTPIVSSNLAALPEIVPPGCGFLIDGDSHSEPYKKAFIEKVVELLKNKDIWYEMHNACKGHDFSWDTISKEWVKEFFPDDVNKFAKSVTEKPKLKMEKAVQTNRDNINTPEYWDRQYKFEDDKGIDQRSDPRRWNLLADKIKDGDTVLDYGCAKGEFLSFLKTKLPKSSFYGVDFSRYAIEQGMKRDSDLRLTNNIQGLGMEMRDHYFDVITSQHVIEHFDDPSQFIRDMRQLLVKDGTLMLVIPLNDDWIEHVTIWQISDVMDLLNKFDCTYQLHHRKLTIRKAANNKDYVEEIIAYIKFNSGDTK